eukprot:5821418-Amphidinium_carterae.1
MKVEAVIAENKSLKERLVQLEGLVNTSLLSPGALWYDFCALGIEAHCRHPQRAPNGHPQSLMELKAFESRSSGKMSLASWLAKELDLSLVKNVITVRV